MVDAEGTSEGAQGGRAPGTPDGGAYEWLRRGLALLEGGDAAAATVLLDRAAGAQPDSASVLEALARAQYEAGRVRDAAVTFAALVEASPDADYAHFGLGLSLSRLGRMREAAEHLALASAMRPDRREYTDRLRQVRATLQARQVHSDDTGSLRQDRRA